MTTQGSGNQPIWWEPVQKFLDNKLVGWGIPGIFVAIAADHAKNSRWQEFGIFLGIAFVAWLLIKIGSKILPYFDQFLDWIFSQWVPKVWWNLTSNFKGRYYTGLIYHYRDYRTKGLKTQGEFALDLDKVFVPLKVALESFNQMTSSMLLSRSASNSLDIWEFLAKCGKDRTYRFAIIGPPGSGKTTLLKHLTLVYASNRQRHHHRHAPSLIPVLIYLRDVRNQVTSEQPPTLVQLINQQSLVERLKPKPTWFENKLNNGQCLVLLDGLDEVADEEQRQKVSQWVDQQMEAYPTPFIVTSRPFGYRSAPVERVRALVEVQPFTFKEVKRFVKDWYLQDVIESRPDRNPSEVQMEASQKAADLILHINNSFSLAEMAINPLLLTMIAIVHKSSYGSLPNRRLELYARICDVLLGRRANAEEISANFTVNQQKAILQTLALGLMEQKTREFDLQLGSQLIQTKLAAVAGQDADGAAFIKQAEDLSGLLVERERGVYEFAHKSLQEYLAAIEIKETNRVSLLVANFEDVWWDETIRLYAAQSDATELIQSVLNRESVNVEALALAYECMEEAASMELAVRQELQETLDESLESSIPEKFILAVQVKLIRRLRQFVRVDDTLQIDTSYVTWAEYQRFAQYQRFLDAQVTVETAESWDQLITSRSYAPGQADKPATGISREEAYRFCAWLGAYMPRFTTGETTACYRLLTNEELSQHPIEADRELAQTGIRLARFWVPVRYAKLAALLTVKQWEEADKETWQMILKAANQERHLYLNDIRQFPCEDLQAIDQLWVQFSEGKYGFSVQKQIWLELGGQLEGDRRSVLIRLPEGLPLPMPIQQIMLRCGIKMRGVTKGLPVPIRQIMLRCGINMKGEDYNTYLLMIEKVGWIQRNPEEQGYYPKGMLGGKKMGDCYILLSHRGL